MALRVFLVDDHEIVRNGLRSMLEADGDIEIVGEAGTAAEAITAASPSGRMWRYSTSGSPTVTGSRSVVSCARGCPKSSA